MLLSNIYQGKTCSKVIQKTGANMGKVLLLTLNEQEEKSLDKIITALSDCVRLEYNALADKQGNV